MKTNIEVSIVIVCMNNLKNLLPCIKSIKDHTHKTHYDIWVVAYLFSKENLDVLKNQHPDVIIIESNEIRGFSENNNLALKQLTSQYALVLNDDTLFKEPVLDKLVDSIKKTHSADIMGCKMLNKDGSLQSCGKAPSTILDFILMTSSMYNPNMKKSIYINQTGIFKSYNCTGACFLIKNSTLREIDYFDEYYFFMPEDLALTTKANQMGYSYYVDSNISLYHLHQQTGSKVKPATLPAARKGCIHYYSNGNILVYYFLASYVFIIALVKSIIFFILGNSIQRKAQWHCVETIFSKKTPKQIFTQYYLKIK